MLALVPRPTRVPVIVCWLVALAAAWSPPRSATSACRLPATEARPSLGLFVVMLQGVAVIAR